MTIKVNLGGTINIGDYNTVRVDISVEGDPGESYGEVFNRAQEFYFDAVYHHVKAVIGSDGSDCYSGPLIKHFASKLKSEPRY